MESRKDIEQMPETPARVVNARFATPAEAASHRAFFGSTAVGELQFEVPPLTPKANEPWEVVAEWDAVPKRSRWDRFKTAVGDEAFHPSFVTWYPLAGSSRGHNVDWFLTGHDCFNLIGWRTNGECATDELRAIDGFGRRAYWSRTGAIEWFLYHGTWHGTTKNYDVPDSFTLGFGANRRVGGGQSDWTSWDPEAAFNPWRPSAREFLTRSGSRFNLFGPSFGPNDTLASPRLTQSIEMSGLPAESSGVRDYLWHPSGNYVVYTGGVDNRIANSRVFRLHLMEWLTGHIAASSAPFVCRGGDDFEPRCVGWSPGGRLLVLDPKVTRVWDIQTDTIRPLDTGECTAAWVRRLRAINAVLDAPKRGDERTSPDGFRRVYPHSRGRLLVDSPETGLTCLENSEVADAAWSPNDPHCFVTVGGPTAERLIRIWTLKGAPEVKHD